MKKALALSASVNKLPIKTYKICLINWVQIQGFFVTWWSLWIKAVKEEKAKRVWFITILFLSLNYYYYYYYYYYSIDLLACMFCFPNSDHVKQFSWVQHYHMVWNGKTNPRKLKTSITWEEYFVASQRDYNGPFPSGPKCLFQSETHGFFKKRTQIKDQLLVGLLGRMVERDIGIAEVKRGSNPV